MKKILLTTCILSVVLAVPLVTAQAKVPSFLDFLANLLGSDTVEEQVEPEYFEPEEIPEDFVDPREVQQVLREIKDIKRELNRFAKELKKMKANGDDLAQVNTLLGQVNTFESAIVAEENLRETIQDFRDARVWEEVNILRAKIEIPREMAQWNKEIKRWEKFLKQKKYQGLGLDLEAVKAKLEEIKAGLARVKEYYDSGDLESAMEEFNDLREDFHPGEVVNVIQRVQELMSKLKTVKDKEIRERIKAAFSEVIDTFNEGDYRLARELLDESWNEISQMISKAYSVGKKKGYSKQGVLKMIDQLEEKVEIRVEEKKAKLQEIEEGKGQMFQPVPQMMPQPIMPPQAPQQGQPSQPGQQGQPLIERQPQPLLQPGSEPQPQPQPSAESGGGGGSAPVVPLPEPQPIP